MTRLLRPPLVLLALLASACGPSLHHDLVALHPTLELRRPRVQVLEASAPQPPAWLSDAPPARPDAIPFVGRAVARSREDARAAAGRDLLQAVASYVGIEVQSRFEVIEEQRSEGGKVEVARAIRDDARTGSTKPLSRVQPSEVYWEKLSTEEPTGTVVTWRHSVLAWVPREAVDRARLDRAGATREAASTVIVAPVAAVRGCPDPGVLEADLALRLEGAGWNVEIAREEASRSAPVVRTECSREGDDLRLSWTLVPASGPHKRGVVQRRAIELFRLEDDLAAAIRNELDAFLRGVRRSG